MQTNSFSELANRAEVEVLQRTQVPEIQRWNPRHIPRCLHPGCTEKLHEQTPDKRPFSVPPAVLEKQPWLAVWLLLSGMFGFAGLVTQLSWLAILLIAAPVIVLPTLVFVGYCRKESHLQLQNIRFHELNGDYSPSSTLLVEVVQDLLLQRVTDVESKVMSDTRWQSDREALAIKLTDVNNWIIKAATCEDPSLELKAVQECAKSLEKELINAQTQLNEREKKLREWFKKCRAWVTSTMKPLSKLAKEKELIRAWKKIETQAEVAIDQCLESSEAIFSSVVQKLEGVVKLQDSLGIITQKLLTAKTDNIVLDDIQTTLSEAFATLELPDLAV